MKEIRLLSVCGMGFGTSLMTLMNAQEIGEKHNVSVDGEACDLGSYAGRPCDLIIASSEIASQIHDADVPVVAINNILDKEELENKLIPFFKQ